MSAEETKLGPGPISAETRSKVRHDLRTPINQILGYSELLQEEAETDGNESYVPDLKKIQSAARRLLGLIDGFFASSSGLWGPVEGAVTVAAPAVPIEEPPPAPAPAVPSQAPPATDAPDLQHLDTTGFKFRVVSKESLKAYGSEKLAEKPLEAPPAEKALDKSPTRSETLLVVDDNELNRDMLSRRLRQRGYLVGVAEDGEQALLKVATEHYDAVLLDVMMPGISGIDVLKTVRLTHSVADLPIIMATAKDDSEDIVEALKLGANDYVTKPLDFPVVLARVETQLSLKKAKEQLEMRNRFIRKTFGRYLSDEVVASLLETDEGLKLGGENRVVTIMMSDLRGFTAASERLAPERVVSALNNYLGAMADIITKYRGTIDEFIGDAILTIFGAPTLAEGDAERAVACALEMQRAMAGVNEVNAGEGLPPMEMGIALNTGAVVVGNIGSQTRAKYGIVGSHVNLTARIESFSVGGQILISDSTLKAAGSGVEIGKKISVAAKGFSEPITAYDLLGIHGKYEISLPVVDTELLPLGEPIAVRFTELQEKHIGTEFFEGSFVKLSKRSAELRTAHQAPALTNLKMRLLPDGKEIPVDLYAKVTETLADGLIVHFTAVPPEVLTFLKERTPKA